MQLKAELDSIYEYIYRLNEASAEDQKYLIAGFEDAVNEGIAKWLGKVAGKITSAPSKIGKAIKSGYEKVKTKAKEIYDKGKEFGKKVVSSVKNWFVKAGESISRMMGEWRNKISQGWETFSNWCKATYDKIAGKMLEIWTTLKEKNFGMDAVMKFWESMKSKLVEAYKATKEKFIQWGGNLSEWVTKNWEKLKDWASEKYDGAVEWLRNKYTAAIEFLKSKGALAGEKIKDAAKWIATWLCIKPYTWILDKVKRIPELWNNFKAWLEKQAMEFKLGFEETSGRPFSRAKGFINPPEILEPGIAAPNAQEEEVKSLYDAAKDPFSLGADNDWKKLGLPKRLKSGKNNLQKVADKYYELKQEGLSKTEIALSMGTWMVENFPKSGVVTENSEQELEAKPGEEKRVKELNDRIDAETDKRKLTELKRELRSLMKYSDAKIDEEAIGKTTVGAVESIISDPRISLYLDDASDDLIAGAIEHMSSNGQLDSLIERKRELASLLRNNGVTDKAAAALESHISKMPKKRKVMPLPEMQFEEGMRYIMTFEKFNR